MRHVTLLVVLAFPLSLCAQPSSLAPRLGVVIPADPVLDRTVAPDPSARPSLQDYLDGLEADVAREGGRAANPNARKQPQAETSPRIQWWQASPAVDPKMWIKAPDDIDPKILMGGELSRPWRPNERR
ncbi:MAG: hypothetical protein AAF730_01970 [Bacteroidota bacterium]